MINHYFDDNGFYSGSAPANPGSEPPDNALRIAPPPAGEGFVPVLNAARDGWELAAKESAATPAGSRAAAYRAEADAFRDAALSYRAEAEACALAGDRTGAATARKKMRRKLAAYLERKRDIRARFPGADAAAPSLLANEVCYYLTATGKYHADGCGYTCSDGEWLRLADIYRLKPAASPCARCKPPRPGVPA